MYQGNDISTMTFYAEDYRPSRLIDLDDLLWEHFAAASDTMDDLDCEVDISNPCSIYQELRKHVFKQDKYLKDLSMFFYNHSRGIRQTMMVTGPSGCGKTEALRCLQKMTNTEIKICDGSLLSKQSYIGNYKVTDLIKTETARPIIVVDEFDKVLLSEKGSIRDYNIQGELLKIIEGGMIQLTKEGNEKYDVDTSQMSFILIGSFQWFEQNECVKNKSSAMGFNAVAAEPKPFENNLTLEKLVKNAGLMRELAGRITCLTNVEPLSKKDFESFILDTTINPLHEIEKRYGYKLRISKAKLKKLADDAFDKGLGIRGINNMLINMLNSQIFHDFESGKECALTNEAS